MVANIGFNPMNNGDLIISVPPLTEDRRRDLRNKQSSRGR
jgi:ribosome recycling factor